MKIRFEFLAFLTKNSGHKGGAYDALKSPFLTGNSLGKRVKIMNLQTFLRRKIGLNRVQIELSIEAKSRAKW